MDAQRAANILGIPYYVWDFSEKFKEEIVDDFIAEYAAGRTPNPCMRCNERIKFAALLEKALALGFDAVCTGHYATILTGDDGELELHRSNAYAKDQSYVLGVLTTKELKHAYFPIGASASKDDIRAEASARGLAVANKPDSYDICFIPEGDTQDWLAERLGSTAGEIVDTEGNVLGKHQGAHGFTVGQRKGLQLGKPAADGRPRYVLNVDVSTNKVVVGPQSALAVMEVSGSNYSWCGKAKANAEEYFAAHVQVRAHGEQVPCRVSVTEDKMTIKLDEPILGVAPGQTAVVYLGTRVLAQTTIDATVSADGAFSTASASIN
jgi:tRNA-specific 2-thiouridylase